MALQGFSTEMVLAQMDDKPDLGPDPGPLEPESVEDHAADAHRREVTEGPLEQS
jgi:hypothetical protein